MYSVAFYNKTRFDTAEIAVMNSQLHITTSTIDFITDDDDCTSGMLDMLEVIDTIITCIGSPDVFEIGYMDDNNAFVAIREICHISDDSQPLTIHSGTGLQTVCDFMINRNKHTAIVELSQVLDELPADVIASLAKKRRKIPTQPSIKQLLSRKSVRAVSALIKMYGSAPHPKELLESLQLNGLSSADIVEMHRLHFTQESITEILEVAIKQTMTKTRLYILVKAIASEPRILSYVENMHVDSFQEAYRVLDEYKSSIGSPDDTALLIVKMFDTLLKHVR